MSEKEAEEGEENGVPDTVETQQLTADPVGPGGSGDEELTGGEHAAGVGNDAQQQPANKKAPIQMPVWRKKRPTLQGSRVRTLLEANFDQAHEAFESIDMNFDGKISMRELRAALIIIDSSVEFSDAELQRSIRIADYDGSGSVDATEFMRAFGPHSAVKEEIQDGLHNIGKTADGKKMAYLSLSIPNLNLCGVELLRDFVYLRHLDVSNNMLSSLSPLGCLPYLLSVDASNNKLTMVLSFKPPLCLRGANFSNNRIAAINPLSQHRFLEELNLSSNRIREISGVIQNVALRKLTLDNNYLTEISHLGSLPLRHLSVANNRLSAVNGYDALPPDAMLVMEAFEETFEQMELAFQAFDANQDGRLTVAEFHSGLDMIGVRLTPERAGALIALLDRRGDGWIEPNEFLALFRRAKPHDSSDAGIAELRDLEAINLSGNAISSLKGLEGHACLRTIDMSGTAICALDDMLYLKDLALLDSVNLLHTPLFTKSVSLRDASCRRLQVCKLSEYT